MANRRLMMNPSVTVEVVRLFEHQLKLSRLSKNQLCVIVTDTAFNPVYADACLGAALSLGAEAYKIILPVDSTPEKSLRGPLQEADLLVYCTTHTLHYHDDVRAGLARGMRALMAVQPLQALSRLQGDPQVSRRSTAGAELLARAQRVRIQSKAGTDLVMECGGRPALANYGFSDLPGHLDFWGGGMVQIAPLEGTMEGRMVMNTGDCMFYLGRYVDRPLEVIFKQGRVTEINGGLEAFLLRNLLESYGEENAWLAGHIAWGTDPRALWTAQALSFPEAGLSAADIESYYGNVQVEIGSNNDAAFQGKNNSKAHLGHCMLNCDLYLDDQPVIQEGKFLPANLI